MTNRSKGTQRPPRRAGWYRTRSAQGEKLRYFDGDCWTEHTRSVPFWADGPDWDQVAPSSADIDSDSGFAVRRLYQPARFRSHLPPTRRRQLRLRATLAWILIAVMIAGTAGSVIVFLTQRGPAPR